jgi:hypothetical protein
MLITPNSTKIKPIKYLAIGLLGLGLLTLSAKSFAQSAPPPPPSPDQVLKSTGNALKKINPFKKNGKLKGPDGKALAAPPAGGPPPPPNPLNLFKKKGGSAALPPPPPAPGRD